MKFFRSILLAISLVSIPLTAIDKQAHIEGKFFSKLSDYRFFKDLTNQIPADEVLPYQLQSELFSDYTYKQRFVYVPPAMKVEHEKNKVFMFPVGSVLIKTFSYQKYHVRTYSTATRNETFNSQRRRMESGKLYLE